MQLRARTAEWTAYSAIAKSGQIADQTIRAQATVDEAIAEARTVRKSVESRIADLSRRAGASVSSVRGEFTGQVRQVAEQSQAHTSRVVGDTVQQLEKEIEVAASSATATSEQATRIAVADARRDFQAQLEQTRAESQRRDVEARQKMNEIAVNLATLTE